MISAKTHKTYMTVSSEVADSFIATIREYLDNYSSFTLYRKDTFTRHCVSNIDILTINRDYPVEEGECRIPGSLVFWMFRVSGHLNIPPPIQLPHIIKLIENGDEKFYIVSKDEWIEFRNKTYGDKVSAISDHAKVQYMTRVLGIDVEKLMKSFPFGEFGDEPKALADGRSGHLVGDYIYIMDGSTCISVLEKGQNIE